MKNKILWTIICIFIIVMTIGNVSAENISKWAITDDNRGWISSTSTLQTFISNWSDFGQNDSIPLVYDLNGDGVNEVINNRNGLIRVLSLTGTLIDSIDFGSQVGTRLITAYDSDACPNGKALYVLYSAPSGVAEVCLTNNTLGVVWDCFQSLDGNDTNPPHTGAGVKRINGDIYSVWAFDDYSGGNTIAVCDHTNETSSFVSVPVVEYSCQNSLNDYGVPAFGNPSLDGSTWAGFSLYNTIFLINPENLTIRNLTTAYTFWNPGTNYSCQYLNMFFPLFVKRGSGNPDDILAPWWRWHYYAYGFNYYNLDYVWMDYTGYVFRDQFNPNPPGYVAPFMGATYPVQLGVNGDICGWFESSQEFACIDPQTNTYTYDQVQPGNNIRGSYYGTGGETWQGSKIQAIDVNGDGYSDFVIPGLHNTTNDTYSASICYYNGNSNPLNCVRFWNQSDWFFLNDINFDNKKDAIVSDSTYDQLRIFLSSNESGVPLWCNDTDVIPGYYPTLNFTAQGTMTSTYTTPLTDYCFGNDTLYEYYCEDAQTPGPTPYAHSCYSQGLVCQDGYCTGANITGTCVDSDSITYPTIAYNITGTAIATGTNNETETDYCVNNTLVEWYCVNPNKPIIAFQTLDCPAGQTCSNGACVVANITTSNVCTDTDSNNYPTIQYGIFGTATSYWNGTPYSSRSDYCEDLLHLREYYCTQALNGSIVSTPIDCSIINAGCQDGACIPQQDVCPIYTDTYSDPYLLVETFGYIGSILNHGWVGYNWSIGVNPYSRCNVLFMNASKNRDEIYHLLNVPSSSDYTITWDMALESSINSTNYIENGMPTKVILKSSAGANIVELEWSALGYIYGWNGSGNYTIVGNWQSQDMGSYKVVVHPINHTYDFYFTNSTNLFYFDLGGTGLNFEYNYTINRFSIEPEDPFPSNYSSVGIWLDNLKVLSGAIINETYPTNFCNFQDCIFYDDFLYNDSASNHGWGLYEATPNGDSTITIANNTDGYYFDHTFDKFSFGDKGGIITFQFKAQFPQPDLQLQPISNFYVYGDDLTQPALGLEFVDGVIYDSEGIEHRSILFGAVSWGQALGSYAFGSWNVYTIILNLNTQTYDIYKGTQKLKGGVPLFRNTNSVSRVSFWTNYQDGLGSTINLDYIKVASGTQLLTDLGVLSGNSDTGVPIADLTWCWSETNGSFNWACCTYAENLSKNWWCPARVTTRYWLGSITNFVFGNFIYFLIIIVAIVITAPYIAPKLRGNK